MLKMCKYGAWKDLVQKTFRKEYKFPVNSSKNWFPGHMHKGLKDMQRKIGDVDCVIEVHDARIPFSGRNTTFKETISGVRPHILVLNKEDLIPKEERPKVIQKLKERDNVVTDVLFTNAGHQGCKGMRKLLPTAIKLIENSNRYHRAGNPEKSVIIIGIPNVGKSTIINRLRNENLGLGGKASQVGAKPGITRNIQERIRVSNTPLVYLLDTPGISKPNIRDMHVGMKLAACNTLNDLVIGELYISDYLLWYLNTHHQFDYVHFMKLEQPEENSLIMLGKSAIAHGKTRKVNFHGEHKVLPDVDFMAMKFLKAFRNGEFGRMYLDQERITKIPDEIINKSRKYDRNKSL